MDTFSDPLLRQKAEYIGSTGWVIPFQLAPGNVQMLLDEIYLDQPNDIDQMFITFYKEWLLLPRVFTYLQTDIHFSKYNALMKDAAIAYDRGSYAIVVGGVVSVVEGLLSDLTGDKGQSMGPKLKAIEQAAKADVGILTAPVVISLNAFLKPLYASSDFNAVQPADVNRHWISHGRAQIKNSQADALKIINAVNSLGYAVKFLVH